MVPVNMGYILQSAQLRQAEQMLQGDLVKRPAAASSHTEERQKHQDACTAILMTVQVLKVTWLLGDKPEPHRYIETL